MADGRPPNYSYHPLKAIFYTATKGFTGLRQTDKWSPSFRDFLARCFESDPTKRATAAELSQVRLILTRIYAETNGIIV
jgi:serine/threonine protein kinase